LGKRIGEEVGFVKFSAAPEFKLTDSHGTGYSLRELKGKKVLLHFWSSTCAPCIKEFPILVNLAKNHPEIQIINVSLDTDSIRWISAVKILGLEDMAHYCDGKGIAGDLVSDYHIRAIPANCLIDEEGRFLAKKQSVTDILREL
jgi:thiol-disulfide isomerase/thioredoxin